MTKEEKQKAIDALKISVPIKALTQEEFNDYIQTLNKIMDWLEQEPTTKNNLGVDAVSRKDVHDMLENLPVAVEDKWFNWLQKACMRLAELPPVTPQEPFMNKACISEKVCEHDKNAVLDKIRAEIEEERVYDDWDFGQEIYYNNAIDDVLQIIDKYRKESEVQDV